MTFNLSEEYIGKSVSSRESRHVGYEPQGISVLDSDPEVLEHCRKIAEANGHHNITFHECDGKQFVFSNQWKK